MHFSPLPSISEWRDNLIFVFGKRWEDHGNIFSFFLGGGQIGDDDVYGDREDDVSKGKTCVNEVRKPSE